MNSKIIMITGGARSGKSTFAEKLASEIGKRICYIATAKCTDKDMEDRIKKHRLSRPSTWTTIEQYSNFLELGKTLIFKETDTFLLDCLTILITNIMFEQKIDYDNCSMDLVDKVEEKIKNEVINLINMMSKHNKQLIIVTNEIGMGLVSSYRLGNLFRDIAGRINQVVASKSDEVYLTVSSIPIKIKG